MAQATQIPEAASRNEKTPKSATMTREAIFHSSSHIIIARPEKIKPIRAAKILGPALMIIFCNAKYLAIPEEAMATTLNRSCPDVRNRKSTARKSKGSIF